MSEPIGRSLVDWCKSAKIIATFERINFFETVFDMRADAASFKSSPKILADLAAAKPLVHLKVQTSNQIFDELIHWERELRSQNRT